MPNISFEHVNVTYTNKKKEENIGIDHIDVVFPSDEISVIVGPSGCGKTTLLKAMCDVIDYEGTISFDGKDIEDTKIQNRGIAYVSQDYALYPDMTIFDNIAFPLKMLHAPIDEIKKRVFAIAKDLELEPCLTRKPRQISGGQQQRTALARALVKNPRVCLFDEPLSNLDPIISSKMLAWMKENLKARGITVLFVTHHLGEALALGDHIYVMDQGRIIYKGTPSEVFSCTLPEVKALFDCLESE